MVGEGRKEEREKGGDMRSLKGRERGTKESNRESKEYSKERAAERRKRKGKKDKMHAIIQKVKISINISNFDYVLMLRPMVDI